MQQIAEIIKRLSKEEGLKQLALAEITGTDPKTTWNYLNGETPVTPEFVLRFAQATRHPEVISIFRQQEDPIGQRYDYVYLDNINTDPISVLAKLQSELKELQDIYTNLFALTINKRNIEDFTAEETGIFETYVQELLDVEHNIQVFKLSLARWTDIEPFVQRHNQKCIDRGYVQGCRIKEKTTFAEAV